MIKIPRKESYNEVDEPDDLEDPSLPPSLPPSLTPSVGSGGDEEKRLRDGGTGDYRQKLSDKQTWQSLEWTKWTLEETVFVLFLFQS